MRRVLLLTLVALGIGAPAAMSQSAPPKKLAASLERIFGRGVRVDSIIADTAIVIRVHAGDALLGYAAVRNAMGKDQPITYLVATDSADALRDIDILVYREPYGGEVAYDPWRKQFRGKTAAAPLQVGKDIRNVSGATISSNAVTRAVRQTLAQMTAWHAEGKLR